MLDKILKSNYEIRIVSGEGEEGTDEIYEGKRTLRALKSRLTKERCDGDRWAKAEYDVTGYGDWETLLN